MRTIAVNKQSFLGSFETSDLVSEELRWMVKVFERASLSLHVGTAKLLIDRSIEEQIVTHNGQLFVEIVGRMPDRDLRVKWYLYSRNRASKLSGAEADIGISIDQERDPLLLRFPVEMLEPFCAWLSASRGHLPAQMLSVRGPLSTCLIRNCCSLNDFLEWWPSYQASPKHRREPYRSPAGEHVSAMPLTDDQARDALDTAILINGEYISSYLGRNYRFLKTHIDRNIYHGFCLDD